MLLLEDEKKEIFLLWVFFYYFYFILFLNSSCVNLLMGLESWKWPLGNGFCGQCAGGVEGCGAVCAPSTQNHSLPFGCHAATRASPFRLHP